jgi:hypothetical protein
MANEKWAGIDVQWREAHREAFQAVAIITLEEEAARQDQDDMTIKASLPKQQRQRHGSTTTTPPSPFVFQSLAETPSCSLPAPEDAYASFILPSSSDPTRGGTATATTAKFPAVAPADMVGPMVQYAAKVPMVTAHGRHLPGGVATSFDEDRSAASSSYFSEKHRGRAREKRGRGCIPLPNTVASSFSGARGLLAGAFRWKSASSAEKEETSTSAALKRMEGGISEKGVW